MHRHMTREELEALYNAPAATVGPEAGAYTDQAQTAVEPKPWQPELPVEQQQPAHPTYDPLLGRQIEAQRESQHRQTLEHQRFQHQQSMERMRYQQAMSQLSGPPPAAPVPLNQAYYAKTKGFFFGFAVGAALTGALFAYQFRDKLWGPGAKDQV